MSLRSVTITIKIKIRNYSGILNNGPQGCFIDNLFSCRRGFIPRSSKQLQSNRGVKPLLQLEFG